MKILNEVVCVCGAYQHWKKQEADGDDEELFWVRPVSVYQHELGAAFVAK